MLSVASDHSYIIVDPKAKSCMLKLNTETVCRLQLIFETAAKKGNNSINRIGFLNITAVVTVTMWHISQQGSRVSSLMTKSTSSREPKKLELSSVLGNIPDRLTIRPGLLLGGNLQNAGLT